MLPEIEAPPVKPEDVPAKLCCTPTVTLDAPVDKEAWATYRQALRDITTQSGFPWEITWPDAP